MKKGVIKLLDALKRVKEFGGIILLPSAKEFEQLTPPDESPGYTRTCIGGIRVYFGDITWDDLKHSQDCETAFLDSGKKGNENLMRVITSKHFKKPPCSTG